MASIAVIVVVKAESDLHDVRLACERYGLTQVQEIPNLGILRGFIGPEKIANLLDVPGVKSVEREREIQLPPPSSPVQ